MATHLVQSIVQIEVEVEVEAAEQSKSKVPAEGRVPCQDMCWITNQPFLPEVFLAGKTYFSRVLHVIFQKSFMWLPLISPRLVEYDEKSL